jgi:C4-dicarboxylate transporter DctM subunit
VSVTGDAIELSTAVEAIRTPVARLAKWLNTVGMGFLVILMLITALDVIMRYVFNRPIPGSLETTQFIMAILVGWGFAYTATKKGHVVIDVITAKFPPKTRIYINAINGIFSLIMGALITWQIALYGYMMQLSTITSSVLRTPVYPFIYAVAFGFLVLCIVYLFDVIENITRIARISRWLGWLILIFSVAFLLFICYLLINNKDLLLSIDPAQAGILGIILLVVLLFSGMSIGIVMAIVGFLGMAYVAGLDPAFASIGSSPYSTMSTYGFSVIPMFVLMGAFCYFSGLSKDLYFAVYKWIGHWPGGLAMATIGACAGFAAICGSSVATVAPMGTVAYPEMKKYNYDSRLATGCIAAGGGLGVLIPPSIILAIYGILTEQSIGKLFLAGFLPGIIEAIFLIATIYIMCRLNPKMGPCGEVASWKERFTSLKPTWGVLALFLLVIGGMYLGVFTATEAAGIGAFGAMLFTLGRKKLTWKNFSASLMDTGDTTSMCFLILVGATILGYFLAVTRLPHELSNFIFAIQVDRLVVFGIIFAIYFILGMVMSSVAMVILTVPIFYPIILDLGFNPIWFGIIVVKMTEIAMITPPVGINVFVMQGIARSVPMYDIFRGIMPFLVAELANVGLLLLFPEICLVIPNMMNK